MPRKQTTFVHDSALVARTADAMVRLRELCGFVENGTGRAVTVSQDDASKEWCVSLAHGPMFYGATLVEAIENAERGANLEQINS